MVHRVYTDDDNCRMECYLNENNNITLETQNDKDQFAFGLIELDWDDAEDLANYLLELVERGRDLAKNK